MENKILNMKMTNFQPESRDMAIFSKSPSQKMVKLHLYGHNFRRSKFYLMTSLANLHKFLYSLLKTIRNYLSMPKFKSVSFEMTEL